MAFSFGDTLANFTGANYWSDANRMAQQQGMGALTDPDYWKKIAAGTAMTGSLVAAPLRGVVSGVRAGAGALGGVRAGGRQLYTDLLSTNPRRIFTGLGVLGATTAATAPAASAPMPQTQTTAGRTAPSTDAILRSWDQTRLASILMGVNPSIGAPGLTPTELLSLEQQRREVGRASGQASARDALQEKQAKEELARRIAAINSYMSAAPQDVAAVTTDLGPAAELGYERTLEREGAANIQEGRQSLKDFLARQELSARQRGANASAALSDLRMAEAELNKERRNEFNRLLAQNLGGNR